MAEDPRIVASADGFEVVDNVADRRYEARLDGTLAGIIDYLPADGWLVLDHTEVPPAFEGRGVAARLVTAALDDIRARSLFVTPACPYVAAFLRRHREYKDLVVGVRGPRSGKRDASDADRPA
jgi:predicted GNAT family acetyltransferase